MQATLPRNGAIVAGLVFALLGAGARGAEPDARVKAAVECITAAELLGHIKVLASDEFEGRAPGTAGEERTVAYLIERFRALGLKPGNPDGTYIQDVPLVGFQATAASGDVPGRRKTIDLTFLEGLGRRLAAAGPRGQGRGFRGGLRRLRGRRARVRLGRLQGGRRPGQDDRDAGQRPGRPRPERPEQLDPKMFKGRAMTYYGRWTYKYEIASEKGAAAAIIVHETGPAGYPFSVVTGSWGRENFDIRRPGEERAGDGRGVGLARQGQGALHRPAGTDFDELKRSAAAPRLPARGARGQARLRGREPAPRRAVARTCVARLEGSDPKLKDEYVIYTAHWDHLGRDPRSRATRSTTARRTTPRGRPRLLEIARAFTLG